jgi:hypothetical protein
MLCDERDSREDQYFRVCFGVVFGAVACGWPLKSGIYGGVAERRVVTKPCELLCHPKLLICVNCV